MFAEAQEGPQRAEEAARRNAKVTNITFVCAQADSMGHYYVPTHSFYRFCMVFMSFPPNMCLPHYLVLGRRCQDTKVVLQCLQTEQVQLVMKQ